MNVFIVNFHAFLQLHKDEHLHTSFRRALQNVYVVKPLLDRLNNLLNNIAVYTISNQMIAIEVLAGLGQRGCAEKTNWIRRPYHRSPASSVHVSSTCCSLVLWARSVKDVMASCTWVQLCMLNSHINLTASVNPGLLINPLLLLMDLIITCSIMRSVDKPAQYRSLRRTEWNPCSENRLYNQGCFWGSSRIHWK